MKMLRLMAALFAWTLLATPAHARTGVPVADFENLGALSASGQPASAAQIRAAVQAAAQQQGWTVTTPAADRLVASLTVRNKHTVVTEITYKPGLYSIRYKDSVNMAYDPASRVIHPFYNKWVQSLADGIRTEAARR